MTGETPTIVVAVDGSQASDAAVAWAAQESVLHQASVTLVSVIAPIVTTWPVTPVAMGLPEWYEDSAVDALTRARKILENHLADATYTPQIDQMVLRDNVVSAITDASRDAWLVVVGCRGHGAFARLLLGSTSRGVLHHAHCPVAVVHDHSDQPLPDADLPVLVGVDGSPVSEAALELAFDEASRRRVGIVALHAWTDVGAFPAFMDWDTVRTEAHEILAERLAGWQERYPDVQIDRRVVCDAPARWLIEASEQTQLVVVGAHGRGGFAGLRLGSVASAVASHSAAPVIVVRSE